MRSLLVVLLSYALFLLAPASAGAETGLSIGLELDGGAVRRVSISHVEQLPPSRPVAGPRWTLGITGADGSPVWSQAIAAPRQFHGDAAHAFQFVATMPIPPAGSRLTLHDADGVLRWDTTADAALLREADAMRRRLDAEAGIARAEAKRLQPAADASALQRQITAGQARADASAMQRNQPPRARGVATTMTAAKIAHKRDARTSPILPASPAPTVAPTPVGGAKATVSARVVREDGSAPGSSFNAWLYDGDGNYLQFVPVPANGQISLDLAGAGDYRLDLQPPPPLLFARVTFAYTGAAPEDFVLQRGWLLDVRLQDAANGSTINQSANGWLYADNQDSIPGLSSGGRVAFAVPKGAALNYTISISGITGYPGVRRQIGAVGADRTVTIALPQTDPLAVQVRSTDGSASPNSYLQCEATTPANEQTYFVTGSADSAGNAALPLPRGVRYDCYVGANAPLIGRWFFDVALPATGPLKFVLQRSASVRFRLQDASGAAFSDAFRGDWYDASISTGGSCTTNPCDLQVPADLQVTIGFTFDDPQWRDFSVGPERFAQDTERTLTVQRLYTLDGSLTDADSAAADAHVLIYDAAGKFVGSTRTDVDGNYSLAVPAGRYQVHAFAPDYNYYSDSSTDDWLFRTPAKSALTTVGDDVAVPELQLPAAYGEIELRARMPCQPTGITSYLAHQSVLRATGADGRHLQQTWRPDTDAIGPADGNNECLATYIARLSPGTYAVAATPLGWPEKSLGAVSVVAGARTVVDARFPLAERSQLWQPTVTYANGTPAVGASVVIYDDAQRYVTQFAVGAAGQATVPWSPGWGVEMYLPPAAAKTALRKVFQFDASPLPATIAFDSVALTATHASGLLRLFGDGDRARRYNILFIAEGYTGVRETFQDLNGNGVWDGVLWHDLNDDGIFNAATDLASLYGNAQFPFEGTVPGASNEPFTDLNGDGALSLDDRALFIENSHSFLRSLLGSDLWADNRAAFNAYAYFAPSPQAGYDIISEDGETLLARTTLYDAGIELDRSILLLDRDAATQRALGVLPEVDIVVGLINQPISGGRANVSIGGSGPGVMIYYGGLNQTSPNGIVQSHEMGHFVGLLCDEYDEFPEQHPSSGTAGPDCANSSYRHQREHLPWRDLVAQATGLPTLDNDGAIGAYIGSSYYKDGAYRPSVNSTMRYNSPFFNAPSRAALAAATCERTDGDSGCSAVADDILRTATWWDPSESGWGLFTIDQGNVIAPGWFTYDLDGEPTWFLIPGALPQADGSYRGDILRYTGVPFPQIASNAADPPTPVGAATLRFDGNDSLQFAYTIDGDITTRTLSRFVFGDRDIVCRSTDVPREQATQYSDLWWSPTSAGWGLLLSHVGDTLYATWYTYDIDGEAVFMVGAATLQADGSYSGGLVRQRDGTPYPQIDGQPPSSGADAVGTLSLRFDNGNQATFAYEVGSSNGEHAITRLQFGETTGACEAVPVASARVD